MRSAILISLALHIAVGFIWFRIVKISQVRFIPRQVFTVSLVTPSEAAPPPPEIKVAPEPEPPPPEPAPEEKREEMPPPPEKPRPKPKEPRKIEKTIPSTETRETVEPDVGERPQAESDVATGDIMIEGQDFPFAYYLMTMKRRIAAFWQVPGTSSNEPRHCRVYFRVLRSGAIESPSIETSSGNFLFDQAALRAVVQASPLPPLPGGFADDYLGVHFSFAYEQE